MINFDYEEGKIYLDDFGVEGDYRRLGDTVTMTFQISQEVWDTFEIVPPCDECESGGSYLIQNGNLGGYR